MENIMIEDLGICKGSGEPLCKMLVGKDLIFLSRSGKIYYASLNNRIISAAKSEKDFLIKVLPSLVPVVRELCRRAGIDQLRWLPTTNIKKDNEMISDAIKNIKENLRPAEIFVLELVQDEEQDQLPKEASKKNIASALKDYRNSIKEIEDNLGILKESSEILLRTVLAKKMWGSKEVMSIIDACREDMIKISPCFNKLDICLEKSDIRAGLITASLGLILPQTKGIASNFIEDYSYIKSFMSRLAQDFYPLYSIDKEFKDRVGYPATWFFNPSTFMDFTDSYENLVKHIIKCASMELEIFEPLLVAKMTGAI